MAEYNEKGIDDLRDALAIDEIDGRTKKARKIKMISRGLEEDFYDSLAYMLRQDIAINKAVEHEIVSSGLKSNDPEWMKELKQIRKDSLDKLKLLEKINKGHQMSNKDNDIAKLILGGNDE
jgi:hypothetical protein